MIEFDQLLIKYPPPVYHVEASLDRHGDNSGYTPHARVVDADTVIDDVSLPSFNGAPHTEEQAKEWLEGIFFGHRVVWISE